MQCTRAAHRQGLSAPLSLHAPGLQPPALSTSTSTPRRPLQKEVHPPESFDHVPGTQRHAKQLGPVVSCSSSRLLGLSVHPLPVHALLSELENATMARSSRSKTSAEPSELSTKVPSPTTAHERRDFDAKVTRTSQWLGQIHQRALKTVSFTNNGLFLSIPSLIVAHSTQLRTRAASQETSRDGRPTKAHLVRCGAKGSFDTSLRITASKMARQTQTAIRRMMLPTSHRRGQASCHHHPQPHTRRHCRL